LFLLVLPISKKLIIIFVINIFLFLFFTKDTFAYCSSSSMWMSWCKTSLGDPKNKCCRDSSCTGTGCGTIYKWQFCHAYECCATYIDKCVYSSGDIRCYEGWYYNYTYTQCSVADSCNNTVYLQPGICLDSGCAKGGNYKICCDNKKDAKLFGPTLVQVETLPGFTVLLPYTLPQCDDLSPGSSRRG